MRFNLQTLSLTFSFCSCYSYLFLLCCCSLLRNKNVELTLNLWLRAMQHYYYPLNNSKQPNSREGDPSVRLHPELPDSSAAVVAGRMKDEGAPAVSKDTEGQERVHQPLKTPDGL